MNTLVIAQWTEDLGWTADVPPGWWLWPVRKDREPGDGDMPNVGREPASFLWWITRQYDAIDEGSLYGFVQGDPFPHCPSLMAALHHAAERGVATFQPLSGDRSHPLQITSDATGYPHHAGLPVAEYYGQWLGLPFPGEVTFWAGGQFIVPGATLRKIPAEWYDRVFRDVMDGPESLPWVLERLWPSIFGGDS